MKNSLSPQYTNSMTGFVFEGIEELVRDTICDRCEEPISATLEFETFTEYFSGLISAYGERGAQGIAYRAGETGFMNFIHTLGLNYQLTELNYRLKNSTTRIQFGLQQQALFFENQLKIKITIQEDEHAWYWLAEALPGELIPWNNLCEVFMIGWLRAYFTWISSGRFYMIDSFPEMVKELTFAVLKIQKQPLGN